MDAFPVFLHALYQIGNIRPKIIINILVASQLASVQMKGRLPVPNNYLSLENNFANVLLLQLSSKVKKCEQTLPMHY